MSKNVSVQTLKYIDSELYNRLEKIVEAKGMKFKTKAAMLTFIFEDYANMMELGYLENPYMIEHIRSIIHTECSTLENHLGGRLTTLVGENAIQSGIIVKVLMEYFTKYEDDFETIAKLEKYREEAVSDLRTQKRPLSFKDLLKDEE